MNPLTLSSHRNHAFQFQVKERSDRLMNYFMPGYFLIGLALAGYYDTWLIAIGVGGLSLAAYYSVKIALPDSSLYQYVLSAVLGMFMAQFIYQMHGLFEMHFVAFIGSALLITYQKWKLQIPLTIVVVVHHASLGYLQDIGYSQVYFTQLDYFAVLTFVIHVALAAIVFFICGLWAYQLKKYNELHTLQTIELGDLQKEAQLSIERRKSAEALEERNTILESITDAFFAVDHQWMVTYWNAMAEKVLCKSRSKILYHDLWEVFSDSIDSLSYQKYHEAIATNQAVHFEDHYAALQKWYEISAYPSVNGLSVYFKDITERKLSEMRLTESEKKYSELFHLSPLPMWVFDAETLEFIDVNESAIKHYGYSRAEFLSMTIRNIRPAEDIPVLEESRAKNRTPEQLQRPGVFRHMKKNGEIIHADVQSTDIQYKGRMAKLILANDITERLNYISAVEEQNEKLKEISWLQSHVVRAPLAKITGLIPLINDINETAPEREKMLSYLLSSAHELDEVIRVINEKTNIVEITS